jgi:membrane protein involved in colicin uptake
MYDAMGVDNVETLLKPDPDLPEPMSPAMENSGAMSGGRPKAFPMQDHIAHIEAHAEFMFTRMVQINPQLYAMLQAHVSEHIALMAGSQIQEKFKQQFEQIKQQMQQAQGNQQALQQLSQQNDQLVNQSASEQAKIEAQMTKQLAQDEEARISREQQDPLVKLKQQEIDLKAMETQMNLQKDIAIDSAKLDLERDKLEADTSIDLMKVSADVKKEDSVEAMALLKENMASTREAMKAQTENRRSQSAERIARDNARSKANGQGKKTIGKN